MAFESSKSYKSFQASSPGSLMIMGEHAVLHGQPAIVSAINKYLEVELRVLRIGSFHDVVKPAINTSDVANNTVNKDKPSVQVKAWLPNEIIHEFDLAQLEIISPLEYVLSVIEYFKLDLAQHQFDYQFIIKSDINHTMGLGSSAAVTIAMIRTLVDFITEMSGKQKISDLEILKIGKKIIKKIQGAGSGADLAASLFGGVLWYEMQDVKVQKIAEKIPIIAVYSGYKLSTKNVIAKIAAATDSSAKNQIYQKIFELIGVLTLEAKICIQSQDWEGLGQLFNMHYGLQEALELSDANIAQLIYSLKSHEHISGAKISGSGLGDCVIGILNSHTDKNTDIGMVNVLD